MSAARPALCGPPPQRALHHHHRRPLAPPPPPPPKRRVLLATAAAAAAAEHAAIQQSRQYHPSLKEWEGLADWRRRGVDRRRAWGDGARGSGPVVAIATANAAPAPPPHLPPLAPSLVETAVQVLNTPEPELKAALFHRAWAAYNDNSLPLFPPSWGEDDDDEVTAASPQLNLPTRPARPAKPVLVATPKEVPGPEEAGVSPAAHLLLNVAHVELNAIDLAADTIARFAPLRLPALFYEDHARVADDETRHLSWCLQRLEELETRYGDVPAHDGLWRGCAASSGDLASRLVVVPMSQEARGLDAGQRLSQRLVGLGDARSAAIVARIAEEERAHVAIGVAWFERVCGAGVVGAGGSSREAASVDPGAEFRARLRSCGCVDLATKRSTFNHAERAKVGLRREWYDATEWGAGAQEGEEDGDDGALLLLPVLNGASPPGLLAQLRERLARMVELEAGAAAEAEEGGEGVR